jgi:RimJ/RimL family protein N-acetyltransferase
VGQSGFADLGLHRIYATYLTRPPASGRVRQKSGMIYEGGLKEHLKKWGVFEDLEFYGILHRGGASQEQGKGSS